MHFKGPTHLYQTWTLSCSCESNLIAMCGVKASPPPNPHAPLILWMRYIQNSDFCYKYTTLPFRIGFASFETAPKLFRNRADQCLFPMSYHSVSSDWTTTLFTRCLVVTEALAFPSLPDPPRSQPQKSPHTELKFNPPLLITGIDSGLTCSTRSEWHSIQNRRQDSLAPRLRRTGYPAPSSTLGTPPPLACSPGRWPPEV